MVMINDLQVEFHCQQGNVLAELSPSVSIFIGNV